MRFYVKIICQSKYYARWKILAVNGQWSTVCHCFDFTVIEHPIEDSRQPVVKSSPLHNLVHGQASTLWFFHLAFSLLSGLVLLLRPTLWCWATLYFSCSLFFEFLVRHWPWFLAIFLYDSIYFLLICDSCKLFDLLSTFLLLGDFFESLMLLPNVSDFLACAVVRRSFASSMVALAHWCLLHCC